MKALRSLMAALVVATGCLLAEESGATLTVYFDPGQVATLVGEGTTSDTIACEGYLFIYTRDKLFTGGGPVPIGRPVRVSWPTGVEAQYMTAGPTPGKARITIRRVDGEVFDVVSFTSRLLANAGAGRTLEIVPKLNGEEPFNDPFYFDMSGSYGMEFSYDRSPNYLGTTAPLVGFDTYVVSLTLDYALTALTLEDQVPISGVADPPVADASPLRLAPNPAGHRVQIRLGDDTGTMSNARVIIHSATGSVIRTIRLEGGQAMWDLCDEGGRPVAAGVYFVRAASANRASAVQRLVVLR